MKKFGAGSESGQTDASRVALDRGGSTRKSWVPFHVRKELADQGENHPSIVSADFRECVGTGVLARAGSNEGQCAGSSYLLRPTSYLLSSMIDFLFAL